MHGFKTCRHFEGICEAIGQSSHVDWFKNHISNPIIKLALCASIRARSHIGASSALLSNGVE